MTGNKEKNVLTDERTKIDGIDRELVRLFCERLASVAAIGEYKKGHGLPVRDEKREKEHTETLCALCPEHKQEIASLFETVYRISRDSEK